MSLGDVERAVGLDVDPDLEANTLSGLFMERLAPMPVVGDVIDTEQFHFRVLALEGHRVGRVSIERSAVVSSGGGIPGPDTAVDEKKA